MRFSRVLFFTLTLLSSNAIFAAQNKIYEMIGLRYYSGLFGHVHQNAIRYSKSLTTLTCGHPVKVYKEITKGFGTLTIVNGEWMNVKVGPHRGYINVNFLSTKKPKCFQDEYPKFFERFDLSISEIYYWGKLSDMYLSGKSRVR